MSEKLEDKTVELLDRSADAVEVFADKLSTLAESYGPEVADVALAAARIDAASGLVVGSFMMVFAIGLSLISWKSIKSGAEAHKNRGSDFDAGGLRLIAGSIAGLIGGIVGLVACTDYLFSLWRWAGVIKPELWIAKTILGL